MSLLKPPPELVQYGLRAMKVVATADGRFDDRERAVLETARDALGSTIDLDELAPIEPAELAAALTVEQLRKQLIGGLIIVALADEDASPAEAAVIERFATALGVDSPYVKNLRRLAEGHTLIMRFDLARRVWVMPKIAEKVRSYGITWLLRALAAMTGIKEDLATAEKYRALEHSPPGSLGRGYFDFIRSNKFALPGEKGGPPEPVILHDLTHTLTGYGTDAAGELQIAFFHAGSKKVDPFFFAFFALLQFHLEMRLAPVAPGMRGNFDPTQAMNALARGSRCTIDPLDGWDPWAVMDQPLAELRRRYNIET